MKTINTILTAVYFFIVMSINLVIFPHELSQETVALIKKKSAEETIAILMNARISKEMDHRGLTNKLFLKGCPKDEAYTWQQSLSERAWVGECQRLSKELALLQIEMGVLDEIIAATRQKTNVQK